MQKIERICQHCGSPFLARAIDIPRGRGKFCSRRCLALSKIETLNATRKPATDNPAWFKSEDVRGENSLNWKEGVEKVCEQCGKVFRVKAWVLNQPRNKARFCSTTCRDAFKTEHQSGEQSPQWVGGEKTYRGRNWKAIRLIVVAQQKGRCADCGCFVGNSLPVHHIKPFRTFETAEQANVLENLIGLCKSCHMKHEFKTSG